MNLLLRDHYVEKQPEIMRLITSNFVVSLISIPYIFERVMLARHRSDESQLETALIKIYRDSNKILRKFGGNLRFYGTFIKILRKKDSFFNQNV